jgi:peptidoglycan hydrolase-like amidase
MSRGKCLAALVAVLLVVTAAPALADPGHDVADDATIVLMGNGSGHGRGMSQYGAYSAARKGTAYRAILRTYYPRTQYRKLGGSIEVLVSADDDNDLVVEDVAGLKLRRVGGRSWAADRPGATRWRIQPDGSGGNEVSYFDGRWTTWRSVGGEVEFTAGSKPLTLMTPDGRVRYRGALRSSPDDVGDRVTVNVLPMEHYLRGVVPSEMQAGWPQQALRAQAVASRSYAAWRRQHAMDVAYDLCDTTLCQVYGGVSAQASAASKAVKGTAKQVLTFRGKPIFAEYSASNGGYTVAGGKPYLPAKKDPYEGRSSDYYGWKVRVTAAQMEAEYNYDDLDHIRITRRDGNGSFGGRVVRVKVVAASGFEDTIRGQDFLADWGLPSTLFRIDSVG